MRQAWVGRDKGRVLGTCLPSAGPVGRAQQAGQEKPSTGGNMSSLLSHVHDLLRTCEANSEIAGYRDALARGAWVYGAGGYGRRVLEALRQSKIRCLGVIDRRAQSEDFRRTFTCPIFHPDEFTSAMAAGSSIIVGVLNTSASLVDPFAWAEAVGFDRIISPVLLPEILGETLDSYWMTKREVIARGISEIGRVHDMLADQTSKDVLRDLISFRLTGDPLCHPVVNIPEQYAPAGVPLDLSDVCLVDGGAFDGDTYRGMTKRGITVSEWIAFEPDLRNFQDLVATPTAESTRCTFYPCGLGDTLTDLSFSEGGDAGSHIANEIVGTAKSVRVVRLDDVIKGLKPTYIKLDIEGYEAEALCGMARTIETHNPALAVCVYHKPDDLWRLSLLVNKLVPKNGLYMRQHGHAGYDTVLYACP